MFEKSKQRSVAGRMLTFGMKIPKHGNRVRGQARRFQNQRWSPAESAAQAPGEVEREPAQREVQNLRSRRDKKNLLGQKREKNTGSVGRGAKKICGIAEFETLNCHPGVVKSYPPASGGVRNRDLGNSIPPPGLRPRGTGGTSRLKRATMKLSMRMRRIATFRWSTRPTRLRSTRDCAYRGEGGGDPPGRL